MEREEVVPFQASVGVFLRFNCPRPDQEDTIILLQPDIGVNDNKEEVVPFQASVGVFLRFNCPRPDQEDTIVLLQPDIGVNDNKDK